jgi:type IV secretory pathway TrbD component
MSTTTKSAATCVGIPLPIVKLNRAVLLVGISTAIIIQQPLITTALFFIILSAVVSGKNGSLIYIIGSRIFAKQNLNAPKEDPKLMRFNNSIAAILLGGAQIAFLADSPLTGWILSGAVAVAATVALAGFCFGCFLFYQFNLQRYKLFGSKQSTFDGMQEEA